MQALGYPYYAIGTRIAFDAAEAYPKFTFGAIRPLGDAEADAVLALRDQRSVANILAEGSEMAQAAPVQPLASAFEQPPAPAPQPVPAPMQVAPPAPAPKPAPAPSGFGGVEPAAPKPAPAPAPQPAPVVQAAPAATSSDFEASLDEALNNLLPDVA
jgi:outer membrane biosynthesis protein TonB